MRKALVFAALAAAALAAPPFTRDAFAQDTPPDGASTGATGTVSVGGESTVTTPPPPPPPPAPVETRPAATADAPPAGDDISDHEKVVGKFAVGYMGVNQLPLAAGLGAAAGPGQGTLSTPVIGVRYWFQERMGIDVGLGFGTTFGGTTVENGNVTTDTSNPAALGFAVHGGLPLVLGHQKHYKFLVIPEINFGMTTRTVETPNQADVHLGGYRLDVGGRAGAEIHFGFIGVPQLSLQATIGLAFRRQVWTASRDAFGGAPEVSSSVSQNGISTTVQSDPWALFTNNISALYYFP